MRYCGIALGPGFVQLASLEEVLVAEPPVRLRATFYEPGDAELVAAQIHAMGDVVVGIGAAAGEDRDCDRELAARGIPPLPSSDAAARLYSELADLGIYAGGEVAGRVEEGAFRSAAAFETNPDGLFAALQGRRMPAKRHPFGVHLRIDELENDHVIDEAATSGTAASRRSRRRARRSRRIAMRSRTRRGSASPTRESSCCPVRASRDASRATECCLRCRESGCGRSSTADRYATPSVCRRPASRSRGE